ncbi:MAG: phosphoadenylyl-sulfate reductase [Actinomycetota bacterium]
MSTCIPELPDLDDAPADEIIRWAVDEFFPDIALACSMQDAVVVDLACRVEPRIEVFFLETGFHFSETLETARQIRERYSLNLIELRPGRERAVYWRDGAEACCGARKVRVLDEYLREKKAWISGVRRADGPTRAGARAVEWDRIRGLVKINPIVAWSDEDVERYRRRHDVIVNPLLQRGYESIGCWPCTLPGKGREGRWAWSQKMECGLHGRAAAGEG